MLSFIVIADQLHKFNESLISQLPSSVFKKPLQQAENVRYGFTVVVSDQLDSAMSMFQEKMSCKF